MISKTKILIWLVVLLVVMNIASISTILYHNYNEKKLQSDVVINSSYGGQMINGRFLRQDLGFDDKQMDAFREINQQFRPVTADITLGIDSLKNEMFAEMQKEQADTAKLNLLSDEIGRKHALLKHDTYQFFLNIKKLCTAEQKTKLEQAFQPLFKSEINNYSPGQQHRRGWRNTP